MFNSVAAVVSVACDVEVVGAAHISYSCYSSCVETWVHVNHDEWEKLHQAHVVNEEACVFFEACCFGCSGCCVIDSVVLFRWIRCVVEEFVGFFRGEVCVADFFAIICICSD